MTTENSGSRNRRAWTRGIVVMLALLLAVAGAAWWWRLQPEPPPDWPVSGNGRIEAIDVDVATRSSGRVREVLVQEGDFVEAGSKRGHRVAAGTCLLLPVDAVAQGFVRHGLELAPVAHSHPTRSGAPARLAPSRCEIAPARRLTVRMASAS